MSTHGQRCSRRQSLFPLVKAHQRMAVNDPLRSDAHERSQVEHRLEKDIANGGDVPENRKDREQSDPSGPDSEVLQRVRQPGANHAETVEARNREKVQHDRDSLDETEESKRGPEVEVARAQPGGTPRQEEWQRDEQPAQEGSDRTSRRHRRAPGLAPERRVIDVNRAARQTDATEK